MDDGVIKSWYFVKWISFCKTCIVFDKTDLVLELTEIKKMKTFLKYVCMFILACRSEDAKYNCDQDEEPVVEKNEGERKENEEKSAKRFKSDEKLDKVILSKQEKKETERKRKCEEVERPHEMNLHLPK